LRSLASLRYANFCKKNIARDCKVNSLILFIQQ
jgi:hypothetical protein